MSYPQKQMQSPNPSPPVREERKPPEYAKNSEIEKIKRQLHHLIDRVDALKQK